VQGKAELVTDILPLLQDFYREKLTELLRHQEAATLVGQYDINNTYQYIINREDVELSWIAKAILELGGTVADVPAPGRQAPGKRADAAHTMIAEDARNAQAFVDRWRPRVDLMSNARHAKMLRVVLGEVLEQKRFFEQAEAGRTDLLGKRGAAVGPSHGDVLPSRWIE
jgi:hypothetical protein